MESNLEQNKLSQSDVITKIMGIKGEIMQSGSVDSEMDDIKFIKFILNQLKSKVITPKKSLELIKRLQQSRQDYH